MRLANLTVDRSRALQVGGPLVLGLLGLLLPALTTTSLNEQIEPVTQTERLWSAAALARSLDPQQMPSFYSGADPAALGLWLNGLSIALTLQQIALVVGLFTLVALLMDEINKFVFWPLHLAGWVLALAAIVLWVSAIRLSGLGVQLSLGPAWVPLLLGGVGVVVLTFRARSRIDTYAGV